MAKSIILSSGGFTGLDQRAGSSTGIKSLPNVMNFRIDESGALEKRNGYGVIDTIVEGSPISAVWYGTVGKMDVTFAACNNGIYRKHEADQHFAKIGETTVSPKQFFRFNNDVYCLGGNLFRCYVGSLEEVEGYVPLIATACNVRGEGTVLEQPNMLSNRRRVRYNADGISISYNLPEKDFTSIVSVKVNGELVDKDEYIAIPEMGKFEFDSPPKEGLNNIEVCYEVPSNNAIKDLITGCRYAVVFESRLFVFGNPNYPDRIYHSELADGLPSCEYFTETGYHAFGEPVTSLIPCYNRLLIFFEDSACFTYSDLAIDSFNTTYTSFPVYELHSSKGCILPGVGCAFENTPVTLCRDGLNKWVSTAIADERSAVLFSHKAFRFINDALKKPDGIYIFNRKATSELWLCSHIGTLIYNYALDCFYIYDLCDICSMYEHENELWLGMRDGRVCLFAKDYVYDGETPIKAEFETPFCSFGAPYDIKNLNGMSVSLYGKHAVKALVSLKRGNVTEKQTDIVTIALPPIEEEGFRRVKTRLHLKRFFSCKIVFSTVSDNVTVKELHLFAKSRSGGMRIN